MDHSSQLDNIALSKYFLSPSSLTPTQRLVLLGIFKHRNNCTFLCFPDLITISKNTGLNRKTVRRTIEQLEEVGELIRVQGRYGERVAKTFYFATHDFQEARSISENDESVFARAGDYDLLERAGEKYDDLPYPF